MKNYIAEALARLPKLHRAANKSSTLSDLADNHPDWLTDEGHAFVNAARESEPPGPGRRSRREGMNPAMIAKAKEAWAIREKEPKLGWDRIAARVGMTGKTLQRYCEVDRLHELPDL